ncbi:sugar phosphate isomerase/epimerase family protein [Streptomyces asiaticus]
MSFDDRLRAAAAAGFTGMSVFPWDCRQPDERRSRAPELRRRADDLGIRLVALDPVSTWLPERSTSTSREWAGRACRDRARFASLFGAYSTDECLCLAGDLGAGLVTLIEPYGWPIESEAAVEAFARVCDSAAAEDLRIQLEFMPFSGIADLRSAWDIVRRAGRANGGLVLDAWHYFRSGHDHELLKSLAPNAIFSVQLSDGPSLPEPNLWLAAAQDRRLPGAGDFGLTTMLALVHDGQPGATIGPEVVSINLATLDPRQVAQLAVDATAAVLAATHYST